MEDDCEFEGGVVGREPFFFNWKIDSFLADMRSGNRICSLTFQIYGYDCWLEAKSSAFGHFEFSLRKRLKWNTDLYPASYSWNIIDRNRRSFIQVNGYVGYRIKEILTEIDECVFVASKERLIQRGILTVIFSWFENACTDCEKESEEGPNKFLETLSSDLECFYQSKMDTDCLLKVGETSFPVHRAILSARSNVFAAMFHHDTMESQKGEVDIQGIEASALGDVIYYIYTGQIRGLSPDTAASMYIVSDKYVLLEIRDVCLTFLINNLTVDNICDAAVLAHTHGETALESKVVQFIRDRFEDLMDNDCWKSFTMTNSSLAYVFTANALLASKKVMNEESNKTGTESQNFVSEEMSIEDL